MFLVWSLDRVVKLYYLILECENAQLMTVVHTSNVTEKEKVLLFMLLIISFFFLIEGITSFRVWALKGVSVFAFLVLK